MNIIPLVGIIPLLFFENLSFIMNIALIIFYLIMVIILSIRQDKINILTIFAMIYIALSFNIINSYSIDISFGMQQYSLNKYLYFLLNIIFAILHLLFYKKQKERDIFKIIIIIGTLFIYNMLIAEFNISITFILAIGYIISALIIIRSILAKYINEIDIFEYIIFGIIYLIAISNYVNEFDGILFVLMLVFITFFSYLKKYSSLCIVSALAIIINMILLTRQFWSVIPWWLYLLLIGIVMIVFSVRNERLDNTKKINSKNIIKYIKGRIEK